jgi:hypothetical protein
VKLPGARGLAIYPGIQIALSVAFHFGLEISWGWAAFICFVAWPLMGTLVTFDDDLPGGFGNPDGTETPVWRMREFWLQTFAGLVMSGLALLLDLF